jgi:hypothetical protein
MFEILPNPSIETIMTIGRGVLLFGAFWVFALAFSRWRRSDERQMQQLRGELQRTFAEVRSLHETIAVMNARMESLNERTESDARLAPAGASSQRGYDLAARLAKNGAAVEELMASCGITRHEAELLSRLHVAKSRAGFEAPAPAPQAAGRKRGSLLSVVG